MLNKFVLEQLIAFFQKNPVAQLLTLAANFSDYLEKILKKQI